MEAAGFIGTDLFLLPPFMSYAEKLKDPRWQQKRLRVLERDNWTCNNCYSKDKTLHVHHLDYEKGIEPWEYPDDWLLTLCEDCHPEMQEAAKSSLSRINQALKLAMADNFMWYAAETTIGIDKERLNSLVFYLFDLGVDRCLKLLADDFQQKGEKFPLQYEQSLKGCPACGNKELSYNNKFQVYYCNVCKYIPEVESYELNTESNAQR